MIREVKKLINKTYDEHEDETNTNNSPQYNAYNLFLILILLILSEKILIQLKFLSN